MSLPKSYGFLLYDNFATLDAFGPFAFFSNLPVEYETKIYFIHDTAAPITSATTCLASNPFASEVGPCFTPTHTLDNAPPLDVIVIPGGLRAPEEYWARFVKERFPTVQYIFSVCSGAIVLAQSGVLDGKKATTNKFMFDKIASFGPQVDWVPNARWVTDGNIWTSSGVEAGTDQAFAFVAQVYGIEVAKAIANRLELDPLTDPSKDPFAVIHKPTVPVDGAKPDFSFPDFSSMAPTIPGPPKNFGVILYEGVNVLDLIGVTEHIEGLGLLVPLNIHFIAHSLEAVSPGGTVPLHKSLIPTHTFAAPPSLDVLIIPGSLSSTSPPNASEIFQFIQGVASTLEKVVTVSNGSLIAAGAGILDNRRATISAVEWEATKAYPAVEWVRKARWVTSEGGNGKPTVYSASGTAAGMDVGFRLAADMYGEDLARMNLNMLEYTPHEDAVWDPWAEE